MAGDRPDADGGPAPDEGRPHAGETQSGRAAFVSALRVRRNTKWGVVVGLAFTAAVFVFFVVIPGATRSTLWYVALAFVLALSTAGLVAFVLTLVRAVRLSRQL